MKERALGEQLAISVGTAIALEEAIVTDAPKPQTLWINLRTLVRNYWGGWGNADRPTLPSLFRTFVDEVETVLALVENQGVRAVLYDGTYESVFAHFNHANLRTADKLTTIQSGYHTAEEALTKAVRDHLGTTDDFHESGKVLRIDSRLPDNGTQAWLLTHVLEDLLSRHAFKEVALLESHTGTVRPPTEWFYKINKKDELQHLPFNAFMLQLFGDNGVFINTQPPSMKKAIIALSMEKNWNKLTTRTRIMENLLTLDNVELRDKALLLAKSTL